MRSKSVSVAVLLFISILAGIVYLNTASPRFYRQASSLALPLVQPPISKANPASPSITSFWAKWAQVLEEARPEIEPIQIVWNAKPDAPKNAKGDREPTPQSIGLKKEDIEHLRVKQAHLLQHPDLASLENEAKELYNGTGIVMVAGGSYLPVAILSIRLLRRTDSKLPVQVFMLEGEYERDACEEVLPSLGAECYLFEDFLGLDTPFEVKTYQLKPLAMLFSTFSSLIFLDADCIPLHDPALLTTAQPYLSTGLVTWPDYWLATEDRVFYTIGGLSSYPYGLPLKASESGQLLLHKSKQLRTLLLATYYNLYGPEVYYQLLSQGTPGEGDKDTFLTAAVVLGQRYYQVHRDPNALGFRETTTEEWHGAAIVQYDPRDDYAATRGEREVDEKGIERDRDDDIKPFFLHASTPKLNARLLLNGDALLMPETGKPIRTMGSKEANEKNFAYDIERMVWEELADMACTLTPVLKDWKNEKKLCQKARAHLVSVFSSPG